MVPIDLIHNNPQDSVVKANIVSLLRGIGFSCCVRGNLRCSRLSIRRTAMTNIYVGNLSYEATEDDIRTAFEQYGQVSSVNIIQDRETGRSRGFAFVEMSDGTEAKQAIEKLDLTDIAGRRVTVNEARPRQERDGGGGRGGRGRY